MEEMTSRFQAVFNNLNTADRFLLLADISNLNCEDSRICVEIDAILDYYED